MTDQKQKKHVRDDEKVCKPVQWMVKSVSVSQILGAPQICNMHFLTGFSFGIESVFTAFFAKAVDDQRNFKSHRICH